MRRFRLFIGTVGLFAGAAVAALVGLAAAGIFNVFNVKLW